MSKTRAPTPSRQHLLEVQRVAHFYQLPRQRLFAPAPRIQVLEDISFTVGCGQSMGILGESGSGKSTLARIIMALETPAAGRVNLLGRDLHAMSPAGLRLARADFQMVFQDPYASLNPRQRIARLITEPLRAQGERDRGRLEQRAIQMLTRVGLQPHDLTKYPHEFSGGQRQRIALARALMTRPRLIVADEPLSALDVTIQAQVLELLLELKQNFGISFLLISHDMAAIHHLCEEVLVLHQGRIVERGSPARLYESPRHPYTQALIAAMPRQGEGRRRQRLQQAAAQAGPAPATGAPEPATGENQ